MPLDTLITGRIATLAGAAGFGWVEAVGIRDGRIAFAGSEIDLETRADAHTRRVTLEPGEVAIPGLTDSHLHLAQTARALRQVDLTGCATLEDGMAAVGVAHVALVDDPESWIDGHGWDPDRWGRWPTADDLERVAPGRRVILWAHDHHALLASYAALRTGDVTAATVDPAGGLIRRGADGEPEGVLHEAAARLVTIHQPPTDAAVLEDAIETVGRQLIALGVVACHDPGSLAPDPDLTFSYPAYAALADRGDLPLRVHASLRDDGLETALAGGLRSGTILGQDPDGWAVVGWQKLFADGSMGSRTAALLADIEPEPGQPLPPERRRGHVDHIQGGPGGSRRSSGRRRDRHPDPRDRRRGRPRRARRPGRDRRQRPADAPHRTRPAPRPGRPRSVRRARHRRERPAMPRRIRRGHGAPVVGASSGDERLRLGIACANGRGRRVRDRRAGRIDRPVARRGDGRPPGGPAVARGQSRVRAAGVDHARSGAPRASASIPRSAPASPIVAD